jgi:hypothetical protein
MPRVVGIEESDEWAGAESSTGIPRYCRSSVIDPQAGARDWMVGPVIDDEEVKVHRLLAHGLNGLR